MNQEEKINRLRLFRSENVGAVTFRILLKHFKTAREALDALPEKARKGGMKKPLKICSRSEAEKEFEKAERIGAEFIFLDDTDYPELLSGIADAPPVLSVMGNKALLKKLKMQPFGLKEVAKSLEEHLNLVDFPTQIMGIINATPDSFYQDSRKDSKEAQERILEMIKEGIDIIDIGGASTILNF